MDPEVIFILVIIIFSMLEGALRKKRGSGNQLPHERPPPPQGWPEPGEFPTDPGAGRSSESATRTTGTPTPRRTAEDLVPEDVWEEIAALARGDVEETLKKRRGRAGGASQPELPAPAEATQVPTPTRTVETRAPASGPPVPAPAPERAGPDWSHAPRRSQETTRRPSPAKVKAVTPKTPVAPVAARGLSTLHPTGEKRVALRNRVKKKAPKVPLTEAQLHHGFRGRHALRHAIIAREVLGRPLALREHGDTDLWSL